MSKFHDVNPGDVVYCDEGEEIVGCLYMAQCNNYVLTCPEYMDCEGDFNEQLALMSDECSQGECIDVRLVPIERVFLTLEEADTSMVDREE